MNQPSSDPENASANDDCQTDSPPVLLETPAVERELRMLLDYALAAITRDKARKRELPRCAQFARVLEDGAFEPGKRSDVVQTVAGTTLTPDDDVREMDATVPRAPSEDPEDDPHG